MVWGRPHQYPPVRHTNYHSLKIPVCSVPEINTVFAKIVNFLIPEMGTFFGPRNGTILVCVKRKGPEMGTEYVPISGTRKLIVWMPSLSVI